MKKIITLAIIATLLFSSLTVNAAEPTISAKQNADYMMQKNVDGAPNWFNGAYYSDKYPDLRSDFENNEKALYNHSVTYGFNESRLVSPVLDVAKYRAFNQDLEKAFGDNWGSYVKHYFEYGIAEGRQNFTDFDAQTYLSMYTDLQNAFGSDLGLATRHYIEFGYAEGRMYNWPKPEIKIGEEIRNEDNNVSGSDNFGEALGPIPSGPEEEAPLNGDIRTDLGDGTYLIETYVNGELTDTKNYDSNNVITSAVEYENGKAVKQLHYTDGVLTSYIIMTYNDSNQITARIMYDASGTELVRFEYTYDSKGNEILAIEYHDGDYTNYAGKYVNEYNSLNQLIKITAYNSNEEINRTEFYEYYSNGVAKSFTRYRGNTNVLEYKQTWYEDATLKSEEEYDSNGMLVSKTEYNEDGTIKE